MNHPFTTLAILASLLLGGCIPKHPSKTITHFTLPSPSIRPSSHTYTFDKTLKIARPESSEAFRSDKFRYIKEGVKLESYAFSRWSDAPIGMIERYLAECLRSRNLFKAIVRDTSEAEGDLLLESELLDFSHHFGGEKSTGVVRIHFNLIDPQSRRILAAVTLKGVSSAPSENAKGGAKAIAEATGQICEQLYQWLISINKNY